MNSKFSSPYYGDSTQIVLENPNFYNEKFDSEQAVRFLCDLARESSLVLRLQACFPEVDPKYPDRPLRHACAHPEAIAPATTAPAEQLVLQTIKNQGKYLRRLGNERGIEKSKKMMDWLSGRSDIQLNQSYYQDGVNASRELMYAFCGILGYGYTEISNFFWKIAFQPPFKHKVWTEVVYAYFSAQNFPKDQPQENWYTAAQEFIKLRTPEMQKAVSDDSKIIESTQDIENTVLNFSAKDTETLRTYLTTNRATFRESNFGLTARQSIQAFYKDCLMYAKETIETDFDDYVAQSADGIAENDISTARLISVILGENTAQNGLPNCWPEVIRKNFPTADLLGRILRDDEKISDTILRKMLLLLEFYSFYAALRHEKCMISPADRYDPLAGFRHCADSAYDYSAAFDEFLDDADYQLFRCGFGGLYPRNPYDCLFMLAASSAHPLEVLPMILENGPTLLKSKHQDS